MESALHPEFLWAQTKDMIYMTITIPNVRSSDAQIKVLDEGSIYFKGTGGPAGDEHLYEMSVQLLHPIKASVRIVQSLPMWQSSSYPYPQPA
mmetsp:Transcript_9066/g.39924  ORF Transcript_9066/g.39924 Transcript_9066/m.39924 type:complete len:92 (+) Transcript_9066:210-485(+)